VSVCGVEQDEVVSGAVTQRVHGAAWGTTAPLTPSLHHCHYSASFSIRMCVCVCVCFTRVMCVTVCVCVCVCVVQGFDEYMNIVLDDAAEVNTKTSASVPIGETLLRVCV
jgi:hypothetical protein